MYIIKMVARAALVFLVFWAVPSPAEEPAISLAGSWRFQLDPADCGAKEHWFTRPWTERVHLPGALQNQGFGDDITVDTPWTGDVHIDHWKRAPQYDRYRQPGDIKVPFFLQPEKHYVGPAWYMRDLDIPAAWHGKRIVLTLERPHWQTSVWFDDQFIGSNDSLCTPHVYELTTNLIYGTHRIAIRVDNRLLIDVGAMAHSVTDHSQGNWNGIVGKIELSETGPVWIEDLQAYPDVESKSVKIKGRISDNSGAKSVTWKLTGPGVRLKGTWNAPHGEFEATVPLGPDAPLWDEFHPALFHLDAALGGSVKSISFGLREISTRGREFVLNGKPVFFRGTLECCVFPLTGYPPTDVASWRRILGICKDYGLNHIRFHSWCPPEAAFAAADELGFYFQIECGVFGRVGDGGPVDDWIYRESERIVKAYGNHPSFVLFTHGNEPHGSHREEYLTKWVNYWKARDSRRLVTTGTAFPILPVSQYHVFHGARNTADWFGRDYGTNFATLTAPVIVHEMGQWCSYPDFDDIQRFNGALKPKNFEIFRDSLEEHGMLGQWRDFLNASGRLQVLCYKEEIESALAMPGIGGFQLLDLHDFPGQGTALVGVLDSLWKSKGYVKPEEFRRFCGPVVPLARLPKRTWTTAETLTADLSIADFGESPRRNAAISWSLSARNGSVVALGRSRRVEVSLGNFAAPARYTLKAGVPNAENDWDIWVYPPAGDASPPPDVLLTSNLDETAMTRLKEGGKVLLTPSKSDWNEPKLAFQPIFWNRYMFNVHALQTLGLLIDAKHPALAQFPTEFFQDWQWNDIVTHAHGMVLDELPRALRPIAQVIDDWNSNRRLGLIFECRVGRGRLLVCAADLANDLEHRPAAVQLRRSLFAYAAGPSFNPAVAIPAEQLAALFSPVKRTKLVELGAKVIDTDSEDSARGHPASNILDGNADTFWQARSGDSLPHHLTIDLGREIGDLRGVTLVPRQDRNSGRPAEVEVFCDNRSVAKSKFKSSDQPQTVEFPGPIRARYVKLVILSGGAALAEVDVVETH